MLVRGGVLLCLRADIKWGWIWSLLHQPLIRSEMSVRGFSVTGMTNNDNNKSQAVILLATVRAEVAEEFPVSAGQMTDIKSPSQHDLPALSLELPEGYNLMVGTDMDYLGAVSLVADIVDAEGEPYNATDGYKPEEIAQWVMRQFRDLGIKE